MKHTLINTVDLHTIEGVQVAPRLSGWKTGGTLSNEVSFEIRATGGSHPSVPPSAQDHQMVELVLASDGLFDSRYSSIGWPSIPTEQLLHAPLLQVLYSARSERQLAEQQDYRPEASSSASVLSLDEWRPKLPEIRLEKQHLGQIAAQTGSGPLDSTHFIQNEKGWGRNKRLFQRPARVVPTNFS